MSNAGMKNFQGINTQAQAGLLLFLINQTNIDFDSIVLEDPEWEDFTLKYRSGKKIICETKSWSKALGWSDVLRILETIAMRKGTINDTDEILIVCNRVISQVEEAIRYLTYGLDPAELPTSRLRDKDRLSGEVLQLLKRTRFYTIPSIEDKDYLYTEALSYFYNHIYYYIPRNELDLFVSNVLVKEIYNKSAIGAEFTREDLAQHIEKYREDKIKNIGTYKKERPIPAQMNDILKAIHSKDYKYLLEDLHLTALSAQPQKFYIALEKIEKLPDIELAHWDNLWSSIIDRQYAFRLVQIFDSSIGAIENARYVLAFLHSNLEILLKITTDPHTREMAIGLADKIVKNFPELANSTYALLKEFLDQRSHVYRNLEERRNYNFEKEEVARALGLLMDTFLENNDQDSKESMIHLIDRSFDLISDDGEFFIYTPPEIFEILRIYGAINFPASFEKLIEIAVIQFNRLRWYEKGFFGWELSGGTSSHWGDNYSIDDRHFVSKILKPILDKEYQKRPEETWQFIIDKCIARDVQNVSVQRPDFLSRATIDILLVEYEKGQHGEEAFEILKDFIKMRRGIPHKAELIFQSIRSSATLNDDLKWALVEFFIGEYGLPWTVFVEQTVADLAAKGYEKAIETIVAWMKNPDYHNKQRFHSSYSITILLKLLASDDQTVYIKGVEILKGYLASSTFRDNLANWDTYDISKSVLQIFEKEPTVGIEILESLYHSAESLTDNQQTLIGSVIEKINENQRDLLKQVYENLVYPILIGELRGDIRNVEAKFTHKHAREYFVQYADKLAKAELYEEAITLVKLFINDSDPTLENNSDDPEGTFNYHEKIKQGGDNLTITTVRGWCAWVLQKFCALKGRDYLTGEKDDILPLVRRMVTDSNYYVRVQGMVPLIELAKNRHTVMPSSNERFLPIDKAQEIEDLTFELLKSEENQQYPAVMKHLAMVLTYMRSMKEEQAMEVLSIYRDLEWEDSIDDIASLYVFFAEFRKNAFKKDIFKSVYGEEMYTAINSFNDQPFKDLLEDILRNGKDDLRARLSWQFWRLPEEDGVDSDEMFPISLHYLTILTESYDDDVFGYIYHFIDDWLETKPRDSLELWKKCIITEKKYLTDNPSIKKGRGEWWPHYKNGDALVKIINTQGDVEFLNWFHELVTYPGDHDAASGVSQAVELLNILAKEGNVEAIKVRQQLVNRQPQRYDAELDDEG